MFIFQTKPLPPIAVRTLEISQSIQPLTDVTEYTRVRLFVLWESRLIGQVEIENDYQPISSARLCQAIADKLALKLLAIANQASESLFWHKSVAALTSVYLQPALTAEKTPAAFGVEPDQPLPSASPLPEFAVDVSQPLQPLRNLPAGHPQIRLRVTWQERTIGSVDMVTTGETLSVRQLRDEIANTLGAKLLKAPDSERPPLWSEIVTALAQHYVPTLPAGAQPGLPPQVSVSIVIATLDRPDDLRNCLASVKAQRSLRRIEIVVVDNNPASGLTPPVVAEFPGVVLVNEERRGLAYARNAGFAASTGEIAIATDDDVILPPDWVERLVTPFARSDVMVVTGNVLPFELETPAQQYFEEYGGLGRGFQRIEVGGDWFEWHRFFSPPTWSLGATANAAFRSTIFTHPAIGLMEESLGPGMPSGVGEDTYLFYKVLKAGYTIIYEPEAYVWHKHRRTLASLRRQLYSYSKGGVGYHLTIALNDGDLRGLVRIFYELPVHYYLWRCLQIGLGKSNYPLALVLLEIWGNLVGLWALIPSRWRVRREGRSRPYQPVGQRRFVESVEELTAQAVIVANPQAQL